MEYFVCVGHVEFERILGNCNLTRIVDVSTDLHQRYH
jgi:hypothetical protein